MCEASIWVGSNMIMTSADQAAGLEALVDTLLKHEVAEVALDVALAVQSEPLRSMIIAVVVNTMQQLWAQENTSWDYRVS